jgi:hypothetical protein
MHAGQTSMPSLTMPTGRWFVLGVFPLTPFRGLLLGARGSA